MSDAQRGQIVPLNEQDRSIHPNVIYRHGTASASDAESLLAALAASQEVGLPFVVDTELDEATGMHQTTVRTSTNDRFALKVESALFHGASAIAGNAIATASESEQAQRHERARAVARNAIKQVQADEEFAKGFGEYYSGLRWSTDQEKFVGQLFEHATEFDLGLVAEMVENGEHVIQIIYELDLDVPYDKRRHWHEKTPEEIFEELPSLDYRKLADPTYLATEEGAKLAEAYRKFCGNNIGRIYSSHKDRITKDGTVKPRPVIPLSKYPLVEALMVDEILNAGPTTKYNFGPREVTELVLDSDSINAQRALVTAVTTRLPEDRRRVFDGPNELEQKSYVISGLMRAYRTASDPIRKEQFKDLFLEVFDSYTGNGAFATEIRNQHFNNLRKGSTWDNDLRQTKTIISNMLVVGLSSPDAQTFLGKYMPDYERGLAIEADPLALTQLEMQKVVFDAIDQINETSDANVFENIARRVFQDGTIAQRIRSIVELKIESRQLLLAPEVLAARRNWANTNSIDSAKNAAAKAQYDLVSEAATQKSNEAFNEKNALIIDMLQDIFDRGDPVELADIRSSLMYDLLARVDLGDTYRITELPKVYFELMSLANHTNTPTGFKAGLLWKISEKFKYCGDEGTRLLVKVAMDGLDLMLGSPNYDLDIPDGNTAHGIAAIRYLVSENPVFKHAQENELLTLAQYKSALKDLAVRMAARQIHSADQSSNNETDEFNENNPVVALKSLLREYKGIEEAYEEFLHLEDVKSMPNIYYPWVLKQMVPFWHNMQWEVGPGNRPSRDIQGLYDSLREHIDGLLVLDEVLPEDFDVIEQGNLDSLLIECYERMVVPHDIKYNNTVWREGLSFMLNAIAMMPESVVEQLKLKHSDKKAFVEYIVKSREKYRS